MGLRGPKTKPTAVQIYQGNPGHKTKAELQENIQVDVINDLQAPEFLDSVAVKEWNRVAPKLAKYKILSDLDINALALYCQSWSDYQAYTKILRDEDPTYETNTGLIKQRPEVMMRRYAWMEVIRISSEFGFTPSSRAGIQINFNLAKKSTSQLLDELDEIDNGEDA